MLLNQVPQFSCNTKGVAQEDLKIPFVFQGLGSHAIVHPWPDFSQRNKELAPREGVGDNDTPSDPPCESEIHHPVR